MFGPKELDTKNTYNPDLQNIQESAERTYGEANSFFRKEELYMKDIEDRIKSGDLSDEKDIYDESHAIASDLAKCCEMYLKALFIYEHNIPGAEVDLLWEQLKNSEYKTDQNGQLLYMTHNGKITFAKYDSNGIPIKDNAGKVIYYDSDGNTYNENSRGSKIKRNGHQLDRLIELISLESRLLLETRMLTIPMNVTENNNSVSVLDILLEKGIVSLENQISQEQYNGWIEQHKKTFEEARYSGQKQISINVEFLYHLATQIKAVVQYKIDPKNNQKFNITDEEFEKLPPEIRQLASFHSHLMSEELIKLISNSDVINNKIKTLLSSQYNLPTKNISPSTFYKMIELMSNEEISYVSYLAYKIQNKLSFIGDESYDVAYILKNFGIKTNKIFDFFVQLKEIFKDRIVLNENNIGKLFRLLSKEMNLYNGYNIYKKYDNTINIDDIINNNNYKYWKK